MFYVFLSEINHDDDDDDESYPVLGYISFPQTSWRERHNLGLAYPVLIYDVADPDLHVAELARQPHVTEWLMSFADRRC